jgi:outer membrane receptor for ferrienterochelin and colicin
MKYYLLFLLILFPFIGNAQNITISGIITDENGEPLVGATVLDMNSQKGVITNNNGFYSLSIQTTETTVQYSFSGMEKVNQSFLLKKDTIINIKFKSAVLKEIVVKSNRDINSEKISSIVLPLEQIKKIPSIGGEIDIIKALGLTPGVSNGTEGSAGLYVRGGTPDQNLILLDDAVVYNPNHIFGLLSVFNSDAIKNVELIKGGFPARYGGRLSSVLDITMKEGSLEKKRTDFGVGIIASRILLERPIIKDKLSILFAARTSYLGLLKSPQYFAYKSNGRSDYFNYVLYDTNLKLQYKINDKNQLYFSFYAGEDNLYSFDKSTISSNDKKSTISENKTYLNWGNRTATLRYNNIISPKIFWKNILTYSKFDYNTKVNSNLDSLKQISSYKIASGLEDFSYKTSIDFIPNGKHYVKTGLEIIYHNYTPQSKTYETNDSSKNNLYSVEKVYALETAAFIEDEWKITDRLKSNFGLRFNNYHVNKTNYYSFEPRLMLISNLGKDFFLKIAYSKMQQNVHLLTNSGVGFQNDIWVPSTDKIRPQKSEQWALGISKYLKKLNLDVSIETYYKRMTNLIDYKEGENIISSSTKWEKTVEIGGIGVSKGLEFFIHKKSGRLNGFISYTLSKTDRQFSKINNGETFPFKYDSPHNFASTFNYQINKSWDFSGTWVFKIGEPITLPIYTIESQNTISAVSPVYFIYSKRNEYRLPNYHRLDIGINRTHISKKGNKSVLSVSVFNAYNRNNIFYIIVVNERFKNTQTGKEDIRQILKEKSLFPILPSVSYSKSF